jgi:hypothetical protein
VHLLVDLQNNTHERVTSSPWRAKAVHGQATRPRDGHAMAAWPRSSFHIPGPAHPEYPVEKPRAVDQFNLKLNVRPHSRGRPVVPVSSPSEGMA